MTQFEVDETVKVPFPAKMAESRGPLSKFHHDKSLSILLWRVLRWRALWRMCLLGGGEEC